MDFAKRVLFVAGAAGIALGLLAIGFLGVPEATGSAASSGGTTLYVNADRDDGLVAHWRFDEVGQDHTADVSKTQAHGPLSGNAQIDTGLPPGLLLPNSGALRLDGSGDYVDTADFDLPDDFTIALWANTDAPAVNQNMVGKHDAGGGNLLLFGTYRGWYHLRIRGDAVDFSQTALPGWQHLAVTGERSGDSTLVRFYLNGNLIETATLSEVVGELAGRAWTIGQDWDGNSRTDFFDGRLDDLRIYDRILAADEIGQLAAGEDHDGASWTTAYTTLERALGAASAQDEIWVAAGVYTPTRPLDPSEIRTATFQLVPDVDVFGGFAGSETSVDQREPGTHVTVLSGDIDGNDTTNGQGIVTVPTDIVGNNAFHVLVATGIAPQATTLDGFTITAGKAVFDGGDFSDGRGGGMYVFEADPILSRLTFQGNAADLGGGLYVLAGDPELTGILFTANQAANGGGLVVAQTAAPTLSNVTFAANEAASNGGGMLSSGAAPTLRRVTFENNVATNGGGMAVGGDAQVRQTTLVGNRAFSNGGGIYLQNDGDLQLSFSTVISNSADSNGGGLFNQGASPLIRNVRLQGNEALWGGGMANVAGSPRIQDTIFERNSAAGVGGGYYSDQGDSSLIRVDFLLNSAGIHGAGIYDEDGTIEIFNGGFRSNATGTSFGSGGGAYFLRTMPTLGNVLFVANTAVGEGGGVGSFDSPLQLVNATFAANRADSIGGGAFLSGAASDGSLIGNAIFWGNQADGPGTELFINSGFSVIQTTNLISGTQGAPIESPLMREPAPGPDQQWGTADDDHGDLRPFETSPAVDAGSSGVLPPDTADLDGDGDTAEPLPLDLAERARIYAAGGAVDIGAYEWAPTYLYLPVLPR